MRDAHSEAPGLRPARVEDHADFVRLFGELGVEESPPPLDVWVSDLVKRAFFLDGTAGAGAYALVDVLGETGYVVNLVVAPDQRGRGLGRKVMRELATWFRARGCREWMLYVKPDNEPALALYGAVGMKAGRLETTWRLSRDHLEALPLAPAELEVVPVAGADLAPLTQAFGLVPGKLARFATQSTHRLRRLRDPEHPEVAGLGLMDVRPQARVLTPFFAATPAHARALLEAAFLELGGAQELRVVTGDSELGSLLSDAGARAVLRTLAMRGPLPDPQ
ncbi:acetyltransferase (GNAT) family protein [Archangium gephyra]|uniref:Acetyltransferase (GNAT) family protein n=1 Tax=Archangium gephyra TaxID=48 RepID=A0AAC8Q4D1_9BACT|nr:GNAT family N-acetyltransferase [Archangium gephyra]AKJ00637.1 Acetyltransferase, GNAT family [Archangium gephyra]REG20681.1 acetyltransferase (GNAT) family protein [Archangium gephyra]